MKRHYRFLKPVTRSREIKWDACDDFDEQCTGSPASLGIYQYRYRLSGSFFVLNSCQSAHCGMRVRTRSLPLVRKLVFRPHAPSSLSVTRYRGRPHDRRTSAAAQGVTFRGASGSRIVSHSPAQTHRGKPMEPGLQTTRLPASLQVVGVSSGARCCNRHTSTDSPGSRPSAPAEPPPWPEHVPAAVAAGR